VLTGAAEGALLAADGETGAATGAEAVGDPIAAGAAAGLVAGAVTGFAAGTVAGTGASSTPVGALAGSLIEDAGVASANAAFVRMSNVRLAAAHAGAIFHPLLREPPRVFMLHNPFFVA